MQRLIVKNFGPIKDLDIEVKDFMVFIGPEASGKSTISKLIYYFNQLRLEFTNSLLNKTLSNQKFKQTRTDEIVGHFELACNKLFEQLFTFPFRRENVYIKYIYNSRISIVLKSISTQGSLQFEIDHLFMGLINIIHNDLISIEDDFESTRRIDRRSQELKTLLVRTLRDTILNRSLEIFDINRYPTFIPAGRSLFTALGKQNFSWPNDEGNYLLTRFVQDINLIRGDLMDSNTLHLDNEARLAQILAQKILQGSFSPAPDGDFIKLNNGMVVRTREASSGQQETLWILLTILDRIKYDYPSTLFLEEPEAHLFPNTQLEIIKLIALLSNLAKPNRANGVVITTHSPYILSALNNLIFAGTIGAKKPTLVSEVVKKEFWLDFDHIGAYYISNGSFENISDNQLKQIKSEYIDSASKEINREYDLLSEIAFNNEL